MLIVINNLIKNAILAEPLTIKSVIIEKNKLYFICHL